MPRRRQRPYDLLRGTQDDYRAFAHRDITKRLKEGPRYDVIEELSAYVGIWMWQRARVAKLAGKPGLPVEDH